MTHTLSVGGPAMPMVLGRPALEAVRLSGVEGVNRLFEDHEPGTASYRVEMADGANFDLPVSAQHKDDDARFSALGYRAAQGEAHDRLQSHTARDQSGIS